ncbi:MAG: Laccase domain protein YfiH, partial [Actinomycetota bacterium]
MMTMTTSTSRASFAEPRVTPLEQHRLAPGVEVHLSGRSLGSVTASIDSDDNLAHHRPHSPGRLAAARSRVAMVTRTDPDRWVTMRQVHGREVALVDGASGREVRGVDGLVTRATDLALVVMAADCVPVLIAGATTIAAVHAGWRGVVAGTVSAAVERMRMLEDAGAGLDALIGPCIGPCCYEVGPEVRDAVGARAMSAVATSAAGAPSVDLAGAVRDELESLGVAVADRA